MSNIEEITFGVEIETTIPAGARVRVGRYHAGLPFTSATFDGSTRRPAPTFNGVRWTVENDASICVTKPGFVRAEFISPILKGEAGVRHLVEMVEFLRELGANVNASCGMHIHIGATSAAGGEEPTAYLDRLARLVAFNSKALYAQTGTLSRERGMYCRPIGDRVKAAVSRAKKSKCLRDAAAADRYQLLNLTNLATRGTVEFRCFAGTLNTSKVLLHLFSVLGLAIIARTAKTPATWDNRPLSGEKAITNFLKVRPMVRIVGVEIFATHFRRMLEKALEMAAKYDTAQATYDAAVLTARSSAVR